MKSSLSLIVALRYFRAGGTQSALMVALVVVGSMVYVFITSLLGGVQANAVNTTIGEISQVTVEALESNPSLIPQPQNESISATRQLGRARPERISEYEKVLEAIGSIDGLVTVSPVATIAGFASNAGKSKPITINGILPEKAVLINKLDKKIVAGKIDLEGKRVVIGTGLARLINCAVGDQIQISTAGEEGSKYIISGIFETGTQDQNDRTVYCSLSNGQREANIVGSLNRIEIKLTDVNRADSVAEKIRNLTGLKVTPWTEQFKSIRNTLIQIDVSKQMIRSFAMISVAFGIASVLGVSVAQKKKEIGIMKGLGTGTGQILGIFLILGLIIGLVGAPLGAGLGALLISFLTNLPKAPGQTGFPGIFLWTYFFEAVITTLLVCLLSGLAPARKASQLNPVEAIRNG